MVLALAASAVIAAATRQFGGTSDAGGSGGTAIVRQGDLVVSVTEGGSVRAKESVDIINEVEGSSTIAELVDEGATVEKDQVLMRMDSMDIEERKTDEESRLRSMEAEFKAAELNLAIQLSQAESNITQAGQKVTFAQMDLTKYTEGDWLQQLSEADSDITLADQEWEQAKDQLYWTERLEQAGAATKQQLKADTLSVRRTEIKLTHAKKRRELLEQYEYPKQLAQLKSDLAESKRELERVKQQMASNIALKEAALAVARDRLAIQNTRYDKLKEQLLKTVIRAPQSGMIVYVAPGRWNRDAQPLAVGVSVRYRQQLFMLPDLSEMEVDVSIHETQIERVRPGQQATVIIDAFPDRKFTGEVKKISLMADSQRWFNPDVKVYTTVLSIRGNTEGLRPGMSAKVEILCKVVKDELLVPVTGVHMLRGRSAALVKTGSGIEIREIEIGDTNDKSVIVRSGLDEGDEVLLYLPAVIPEIPWEEPQQQPHEAGELQGLPVVPDVPPPGVTGDAPPNPDAARREELRKRMENATPEEREKLREEMRRLGGSRPRRQGTRGEGTRGNSAAPRSNTGGGS